MTQATSLNPPTRPGAYRAWTVRTVVVRLSRKLTATYRLCTGRLLSRLLAIMLAGISTLATALPEGANVVAGQATVSTPGANSMVVTQGSEKAILNWQSFNIGAGQSMQFVQPSAASVALNRVVGANPSSIYGSLSANGQVFLINPAGVMFAPGAQVNVGSLVATTLGISNEDFVAGRYTFNGNGNAGSVANGGAINVVRGGYVLLAAPSVSNTGTINADAGSVGLVAASRVSIDKSGAGLVRFSMDAAAANAVAANSGVITAQGGHVAVLASALGDAMATVINQSGVIRATSATERNGMIVLSGGSRGVVHVSGTLDASGTAPGQTGGTVHVLGDKVALDAGASIDVSGTAGGGTALIGGDYQGSNAAIQNASRTYIAAGATVRADATDSGNGGKVVVWADGDTRHRGAVSARGGAAGGNGGFVEVSGKQQLDLQGSIDVAAPNGTGGKVLLDPQDILLNATTQPSPPNNPNGTPDVAFADAPAAGTYTIQVGDVTGYSELHLQATRNITLSSALAMTSGNSVKFEAGNTIAINAALTASGGVSLSGANVTSTAAGVITSTGAGNTNGGNVSINATGSVSLAGNIVANGGAATAGNPGRNGGAISITGAGVALGAATLTASGTAGSGAGQPGGAGGTINVTSTNGISGTGAITASGGSGGTGNAAGGNAGTISISNSGAGNITTGTLTAQTGAAVGTGAGGTAGSVSVNNTAGNVTTGAATTTGLAMGHGGNVSLSAAGTVTAGTIIANGGGGLGANAGRNAGTVTITGAGINLGASSITASGGAAAATTSQAGGSGGTVTLTSTGGVTRTTGGAITANGGSGATTNGAGGNAGTITVSNSGAGNIALGALAAKTGAALGTGLGGTAGSISVTNNAAGANLTTLAIDTAGGAGGNGGAVTLASQAGVTVTGTLNTSGTVLAAGTRTGSHAGNVTITGVNRSITGNITASGSAANGTNQAGGNAGVVSITGSGTLGTGAITASTGAATGTGAGGTVGSIALTGTTVTAGALTTTGGSNGAGGDVSATASTGLLNVTGAITTSGGTAQTNTAGKSAGTVTLTGNSVATVAITANGSAGSGTNRAGGNGAAVTVTGSGGNVSVGAISVAGANAGTGNANGGSAGSITLDAGGGVPLITLNGNLTATGGNRIGTGIAGSGGQVWVKDAATQTANLTVNTIGGTTGGTGGAIRLDGALNEDATARTLTLTAGTGAITLAGGTATSAVTTLSATGASIALGSVQTKGAQSYTGATSLNGNLATLGTAGADTITFNSPVTLTGNSSITTAGGVGDNIAITQAINGGHNLTLNAGTSGNVTTTAGIGQTTALGAFSATGAAVSLAAVRAAGILARSTTGNLTLNGVQTATGGGDSVVLVAKQNFVNNVGATAINPGAGRWLVYSTNPTSDTRNGLVANFKQYNATYGDAILGTGNGFIHTIAPTITASLTGTGTKVYDGTTSAALTAANYSSSAGIDGDVVTLNNPTTGSYADKNVGTGKTVSVSGITASASNGATTVYGYQVSGGGTASGNIGDITARALTVSATGTNKVYDATTNAVVSLADNRVAGDVLTASNTAASFADKNVGVGKAVNVTGINVTGTDAANYTFNTTATTTANITPATIANVTGITANTKVADGNTAAALNTGAAGFTGLFGGDVLNVAAATGNFDTAAPGIGKPVAITGIALGGADAGNYVLANTTANTVATIVDAAGQGGAFRPSVASSITLPTAVLAPASAGLSVAAMNALLESAPSAAGPCVDPEAACATADSAVLVQTLREPADQRPGIVSVGVSSELVATGAAFRFALPKGLMVMAADATVEATTLSGKPLPPWLRFDAASGAFIAAAVPSGALPQQLRVGLGSRSVVLTMAETAMATPALRNAAAKSLAEGG